MYNLLHVVPFVTKFNYVILHKQKIKSEKFIYEIALYSLTNIIIYLNLF